MPRAGLNTTEVVVAGAELADEAGYAAVSLAALAARLGVKAPALYKHVDGIGDLQHPIATLAMTEAGMRSGTRSKVRHERTRSLSMASYWHLWSLILKVGRSGGRTTHELLLDHIAPSSAFHRLVRSTVGRQWAGDGYAAIAPRRTYGSMRIDGAGSNGQSATSSGTQNLLARFRVA